MRAWILLQRVRNVAMIGAGRGRRKARMGRAELRGVLAEGAVEQFLDFFPRDGADNLPSHGTVAEE